jgi:hypothetical protein
MGKGNLLCYLQIYTNLPMRNKTLPIPQLGCLLNRSRNSHNSKHAVAGGCWSIRQKNGFAELDLPNRHNAEMVWSIRQNLPNNFVIILCLFIIYLLHIQHIHIHSNLYHSNHPYHHQN